MKNLWRFFILFMLPGAVLAGSSAIAFFRLADCDFETLLVIPAAAVEWGFFACIGSFIALRLRNPSRFYYFAAVVMATAFVCVSGACARFLPENWMHGIAGVAISALAWAFIVQGFSGSAIKKSDRMGFIAGTVGGAAIFIVAAIAGHLAWLETFFHYLAVFLVLGWCLASPVSSYGRWYKRLIWRVSLLAVAVCGFFLAPVFTCEPWNGAPEQLPGSHCNQTLLTPRGTRFVWIDKDDQKGIFTPGGRLEAWFEPDEDMVFSLPLLLGCVKEKNVRIKLAGAYNSAVPRALMKLKNVKVDSVWITDSLILANRNAPDYPVTQIPGGVENYPQGKYNLLIISAWQPGQYPGAVQNFWNKVSDGLSKSGVVAVREQLLHNPAVFRLLHERYPYNGVLPGPCRIRVFSEVPIDLSLEAIDDNLVKNYDIMPGMIAMLYNNLEEPARENAVPEADILKYGNNLWFGHWWWYLAALAVMLLWRMLRLAGERRNIMYSFWNSMENGFAGMGTLLLCIGLMIQYYGLPVLAAVITSMSFALVLCRGRNNGWISPVAVAAIPLLMLGEQYAWGVISAAVVHMYFTGSCQTYDHLSIPEQRKLLTAMFMGMFIAALLMSLVWLFNVPLIAAWAIFLAAKVPAIWQKSNKHVY